MSALSSSLPHGATLRAWAEAHAAGDRKRAIEILWKLHSDDILRYCRRMVGNDAEADDVTQKVFVDAIKSMDRLRGVDHPRRWLIGIARHRCLDHARSARRAPRPVDATTLCEIAGAAVIARAGGEDPRTAARLDECLDCLDPRDRKLIELRFYQGLPYKQIAAQLGTTPAALRVRVMRACFALRRHLRAVGELDCALLVTGQAIRPGSEDHAPYRPRSNRPAGATPSQYHHPIPHEHGSAERWADRPAALR